jgi:ABC-type glycerol-3-phosphate transport system substrate-binding protein
MNNKKKVRIFSILVVVVLLVSMVYRLTVTRYQRTKSELPELAKNKNVVAVWLKESYYSDSVGSLIDKYNKENKDNIYIDYHTYGNDYFNMLRISMMTRNKPDIFQFGFYDFLKNNQLYTMNELGIDYANAPENNMFYYKGKPVGVKVAGNTVRFIWNKDIFQAAGLNPNKGPKSWDEVIQYARAIKKKFPNMIPFEFPAASFYDLKVSIGETSVNQGNIYTSFWDYKNGKYDYTYSKDMLKVYNQMYKEGLIPSNFNEKDKKAVREDFFYKKTAMAVSTYEDKTYFLTNRFFDFYMGVSGLPRIHGADSENYYYMEDVNCLVANRNDENKDAIRKVYQWLLNTCLNNTEVDILKFKSQYYPVYKEYDRHDDFSYELKDPTATLGFNQSIINSYFYDAIRGTRKVDNAVSGLNSYMKKFTGEVNKIEPGYFENYIDKE